MKLKQYLNEAKKKKKIVDIIIASPYMVVIDQSKGKFQELFSAYGDANVQKKIKNFLKKNKLYVHPTTGNTFPWLKDFVDKDI